MDRLKGIGSICTHAGRSVVHPVTGGHRAHCLACGMVGPFRKSREEAHRAITAAGTPIGTQARRCGEVVPK